MAQLIPLFQGWWSKINLQISIKLTPSVFSKSRPHCHHHLKLCFYLIVIPEVKHAAPFFKGFWKCSLSKGYVTLAFFQRLVNCVYKSPLFQRFASTQIPFQIVLCHCALFQRFVDVSQLTPFFKGTSKQVPWDVKVSVKPCNLCEGLCQALISTLLFWLAYLLRNFHQKSFKKTSTDATQRLMPPKVSFPFFKGNSLSQR